MAQRVYATLADFTDFLDPLTPPPGSERMLREASREIDQMLLSSVYDTDEDGYPTDVDAVEALKEATCAQAEYAKTIGDRYGVGGLQYHAVSLGSAGLTRGYSAAGSSAAGRWSAKAWQILQRAGLTGHESSSW